MEMISKKELLEATGISYGQLYRWKRERLLPEEWFVKQSSFTGQETFFPRERVLARVKAILELKDTHSLEELAGLLADDGSATLRPASLAAVAGEVLSPEVLALFPGDGEKATVAEVAMAMALARSCSLAGLEGKAIAELVGNSLPALDPARAHETSCTLFEARGEYHVCLTRGNGYPAFDRGVKAVAAFSLADAMGDLRVKLDAAAKAGRDK